MSESVKERQELLEGRINLNLDKNAVFTKIKIAESSDVFDIVVVGEPAQIENKIFKSSSRSLLKG